jgi:hypothetical protein
LFVVVSGKLERKKEKRPAHFFVFLMYVGFGFLCSSKIQTAGLDFLILLTIQSEKE